MKYILYGAPKACASRLSWKMRCKFLERCLAHSNSLTVECIGNEMDNSLSDREARSVFCTTTSHHTSATVGSFLELKTSSWLSLICLCHSKILESMFFIRLLNYSMNLHRTFVRFYVARKNTEFSLFHCSEVSTQRQITLQCLGSILWIFLSFG